MPVRQATRADLPAMAKVFAASFGPDPLFQFIFPHQAEHPEGFLRAAWENMWVHWYDYSQVHVVAYEIVEDGSDSRDQHERSALLPVGKGRSRKREVITGIAQWERLGEGWEHVNGIWGRWDPRRLLKPLVSAFFNLRRLFIPNKAEPKPTASNPDPVTLRNFLPRIIPFSTQFFDAPHRQTRWSLEVLAVLPEHQGKGIGRELVAEGLARAKQDPEGDLPVCVVAAEGKEHFYQKVGFGELVGYTSTAGGDANPLYKAGIRGGAVLWTK